MLYQTPYHSTELSNTSFLVTGGAGFIGSNIVEYLVKYGAKKVRVLDNLSTGYLVNLKRFIEAEQVEFLEGDIRNRLDCAAACKDIDIVLHQAALGSVPRSVKDPATTNEVNVNGIVNMLWAAQQNGVKRFVFASSSSVYGDDTTFPKQEDKTGNLLSPYAVTKKAKELYADVFSRTYGLETIGLRYFNVFGPQQSPEGAYAALIPLLIQSVITGQSPSIFGDGEQSRDFTFIENAVQANIRAAFAPKEAANKVYNIAFGDKTSVNEMWAMVKEAGQSEVEVTYAPPRKGDIKDSLADISRAKSLMAYAPLFSVKDGLAITLEWYKENYHRLYSK